MINQYMIKKICGIYKHAQALILVVTGGIIAIPIKITVDRDHPETKKLVTIAEKSRREDKRKKCLGTCEYG